MKKAILLLKLFLFILLGSSQGVFGQNFPVQVIPQALPPAPIYFSDYANEGTINGPLRAQIVLNALSIANREVRLKTYFEGNGISFQSNDIVNGAPLMILEGGIPLILTNAELAPYFKFENISGISPTVYGQPIPEGTYQFCFEIRDAVTNRTLSNKSCVTSVVFQNEPPILVLPQNKATVENRNPLNIVFQWTPRAINVSNVEYELSIVELWDDQLDPQAAFLASSTFFQTTTTGTTYVYGPADPLLLDDKNYAWRVQAKAKQGTEEIGVFKNRGFSEIFFFGHAQECNLPLGITAEVKGATNANILWQDTSTTSSQITVRYRKKGTSAWFEKKSTGEFLTVWDLEAGTEYEYQIAKSCAISESDFSLVQTFRTNLFDDDDSTYNCGIAPDINVTNVNPLESLSQGDKFTAGDFPVTVLESSSGGSGRFTGKGYVTIPYLKSIKVAVEFTNILINENKELAQGNLITAYDPTLSNIIDPGDTLDDIGDIIFGGDTHQLDEVDFAIENARVSEDGEELIISGTDEQGNPQEVRVPYDEADSYRINGTNGGYEVGPDGIDKLGDIADGGTPDAGNTGGLSSSGDGTASDPSVATWADNDVTVRFYTNSKTTYGFDDATSAYEKEKYPKVNLESGGQENPVHKAVLDGVSDTFLADITIKNSDIKKEDLVFKTINGIKLEAVNISGDTYEITLKGGNGYSNEEALITYKKADDTQVVVSSFFMHHLKQLEPVNVVIVEVDGYSVPNSAKDNIAGYFTTSGANISIEKETYGSSLSSSLQYNSSGLLSNHPESFKKFYQEFKNTHSNYSDNTYYVFAFDDTVQPGNNLGGFMPRGSQFGFIFSSNINPNGFESKGSLDAVIGHEIAHGVFDLKHPFEAGQGPAGTDWLIDYGNGTELSQENWKSLGYEGIRLYFFDKDEDGAYTPKLAYMCIPASISKPNNNETYFTHKGKVIILNSKYEPYAFVGKGDSNGNKKGGLAIIRRKSDSKLYFPAQDDTRLPYYYARLEPGKLDVKDVFSEYIEGDLNNALKVLIGDDCSYELKRGATIIDSGNVSSCECFSDSDEGEDFTNTATGTISTDLGTDSEIAGRISDTNVAPDTSFDQTGKFIDKAGIFSASEKREIIEELNSLANDHKIVILENTPTKEEFESILQQTTIEDNTMITIAFVEKDVNGNDILQTGTITRDNLSEIDKNRFYELSSELKDEFAKDFSKGSIDFFKSSLIGEAQLLQFVSDLLESIKVPEKYWNPQHVEYPSQMPLIARVLNIGTGDFFSIFGTTESNQMKFAFKTGLWNGVVDEVKGLVDLAKLASDYFLDEEKRKEINESFKKLTVEKIWKSFEQAHGYESGKITNQFKLSHQLGKDVVFVASFFTGVGAITKAGKINKIGDVAKAISSGAIKFVKQLPSNIKSFVTNLPNTITKTVVNGYLALKIRTTNLARISEQGVLSQLRWLDEGKVLRLTNEELAILEGAKHFDSGIQDDVLILLDRSGKIGFKVKRGFDNVEEFTSALIAKMAKPLIYTASIGKKIVPTPGKTTTILGNYRKDIRHILEELNYPKTKNFEAKNGGYNLLNVKDELYKNPHQFWDEFNRPFLDKAISRSDEIVLATKPTEDVLFVLDEFGKKTDELTGFGREIKHLEEAGYEFVEAIGKMVKKTPSGKWSQFIKVSNLSPSVLSKLDNWAEELIEKLEEALDKYPKLSDDLNTEKLFDATEIVLKNPRNAWDAIKEASDELTNSVESLAKSQFFKVVVKEGKDFENLVTAILTNKEPFKTLVNQGYIKLSQIHLRGNAKKIIADDILVKKEFDDILEVDYFKAILNDSKLTLNSPWTPNQLSELINVFKNNPGKKYIEFEVRTSDTLLKSSGAPSGLITGSKVRIYRADVYKTISDGTGKFKEIIQMFQ